VKNPVAINLLFLEAYHNYIKCLYPCSHTDATVLAGILMQINNGEYDPVKPVSSIVKYDSPLHFVFVNSLLFYGLCCFETVNYVIKTVCVSSG